jgi:hypothetical protein
VAIPSSTVPVPYNTPFAVPQLPKNIIKIIEKATLCELIESIMY